MGVYMGDQQVDGGSGGAGVTLEQVESAIDEAIGDINAVLDAINGEVV